MAIAPILMSFHEESFVDPTETILVKQKETIEQVFGVLSDKTKTVQDIRNGLKGFQSEFGKQTLDALDKKSPTSLKVTLEGLRRGMATESLVRDLAMEFRMAQAFTRPGSDFYEGVRAMLVDKDDSPKWNPGSLEHVTEEHVESYFAPIEYEWEPASPSNHSS